MTRLRRWLTTPAITPAQFVVISALAGLARGICEAAGLL